MSAGKSRFPLPKAYFLVNRGMFKEAPRPRSKPVIRKPLSSTTSSLFMFCRKPLFLVIYPSETLPAHRSTQTKMHPLVLSKQCFFPANRTISLCLRSRRSHYEEKNHYSQLYKVVTKMFVWSTVSYASWLLLNLAISIIDKILMT